MSTGVVGSFGFRAASVFLAALVAAGCGGPTEPDVAPGSMSLSYSGAVSGTFATTGAVRNIDVDGATAMRFDAGPESASLSFMAIRRHSDALADMVFLGLPDVAAPQTISLSGACVVNQPCATLFFVKDQPMPIFGTSGDEFMSRSGSVVVNSVSATRIAGTFQFTAESNLGGRVITVTDGKFDVPIMPQERF